MTPAGDGTIASTGPMSADSHAIEYRRDIDGLRAVSVLAVIAYHLRNDAVPGGYLGVDIFFAISGFLIMSISVAEIERAQFSFGRFYERRIRRILPAMLALCVTVTAVSTYLLLPSDLVGYARSLLATLVFVSNVYFWKDTDYFAAIATTKPLLHLWSLGVEEQFYLLFPPLAFIVGRLRRGVAITIVAAITLASLMLLMAPFAANAGMLGFYLLPTRAWEFGGGALVALLPAALRDARMRLAPLLGFVGACLIGLGLGAVPFPTVLPAAFPAVIGAMLILAVPGRSSTLVTNVLRWRPLAFVGLISYSLYLWHWPLIVFATYYLIRPLEVADDFLILVATFLLAILSWVYVEQPFRKRRMGARRVVAIITGTMLCLAVAALGLIHTKGLPGRLPLNVGAINAAVGSNYHCPVSKYVLLGTTRACELNLPGKRAADAEIVLFGNSHAQMYAPAWASILHSRGLNGLMVARPCLPTPAVNLSGCSAPTEADLNAIMALPKVRIVVIALMWLGPGALVDANDRRLDNRDDAALIAGLDDLIARLHRAGKQVILLGPIPKPDWDVASDTSRALRFGRPLHHRIYEDRAMFERAHRIALAHFKGRNDLVFVAPHAMSCGIERCDYMQNGRSLYADSNHIAAAELGRFIPVFAAALDQALRTVR